MPHNAGVRFVCDDLRMTSRRRSAIGKERSQPFPNLGQEEENGRKQYQLTLLLLPATTILSSDARSAIFISPSR